MTQIRRAAPQILGGILVVLGLGLTMTASAQPTQGITVAAALDKVGPVLAILGALFAMYKGARAAVRDVAVSVVEAHDDQKTAHEAAAHANHKPIEDALEELNKGMASVLARLDTVGRLAADVQIIQARLRAIEDRHLGEDSQRQR